MRRRYNLAHFILANVVALILTPLMVDADPQAQIAFSSNRNGNSEIYVINAGGAWQPRRLTNNPHDDTAPAWYDPAFAVAPAGKTLTMWRWLKQVHR